MASREQRARVSVCQYFPRAVPGTGCHGFVLQREKQPSHEGQYLTPSVTPWALTPSHLTFLISVSPLPNAVVCTKEAINAFLFQNVSFCSPSVPTSTEHGVHLPYQRSPTLLPTGSPVSCVLNRLTKACLLVSEQNEVFKM